jgi:peptidoglycan/xylan/chitin deacetylase (PgdA/CDA1 family)
VLVLLYHRVADLAADPQRLCVARRNFAEQMEVVRAKGVPMSLRALVDALREGRLPRRAVVVTFDDGYADNLHNAKPLLAASGVPATVFVTSGYVGQSREYWWDELERLLLSPQRLPERLTLNLNGTRIDESLEGAACLPERERQAYERWNVRISPPTKRHALYLTLHKSIRPLSTHCRDEVLDALRVWSGSSIGGRATHRSMSEDEVRRLSADGLIEVGAHTVSHPVLSCISDDAQRQEIRQSKASLEEILDRPVTSFAYPFGSRTDYRPATASAVQQEGFMCACSNYPGVVRKHANPFELPRMLVGDWNGDEFARRIDDWFVNA